jgi:hypothetical protein
MNVSSGARLEFGKPSGGGKHKVGGKGMECKGRMDLRNKTEVDFDGRLHIGKGGRLSVTKGSKVKFGKPKDGTKHLIQGDGIINEGAIEFTDGETDVSAPLLSIGDEAQITTAAASTVTFADVEEVASSRRRLGAGSTTKHEFLGKGSKNEGKTKFGTKHKANASIYDNEGDLEIEGTDAELSAEDFKQTKGRTVVKSGGILRSNGSKPLKFHGGKMRGSGGTYKGNCELRNSTRLSPGDPDDASSLGRSKLTIDGDLDMDSTTFTDIKMKKTVTCLSGRCDLMLESDSVEITGRAKLAGRLNVDVSELSSESKTFTVLKAAGGIEGTFDGCDGCGAYVGAAVVVTYVTTTRRLADGRQLSEANEVQVTVTGTVTWYSKNQVSRAYVVSFQL